MRLHLLGLAAVLVALPAAAQTVPAQTEGAWTPPRSALSSTLPILEEDKALQAAVAAPTRPPEDRSRDAARHPYESLTFWGLQPGLTVVEIEPGRAGWWRNILEPYAAQTGGTYMPVNRPLEGMGVDDNTADMVVVVARRWCRRGVVGDSVCASD
jgi:predicted methyltransferase